MAAEAHTVTLLDQKTFIGSRRMVPCTLTVTNYNGTTGGSIITAAEVGLSRIIYVSATDAGSVYEPYTDQSTGGVRFRVASTGLQAADNTNLTTLQTGASANILVFGV